MTSVLAIGKFPPTQGGTANQLLWLTVRLAELGIDVAVVDASYALDPHRRCAIGDDDWAALAARVPVASRIRRVVLESDLGAIRTIPTIEPVETRLVDAGLAAAESIVPDLIFTNYLDPYATAATRVAEQVGCPLVYRHAGSDITYQAPAMTRSRAYRHVFERSDLLLTTTRYEPFVRRLGGDPEAVRTHTPIFTPDAIFTPDGPADDLRTGVAAAMVGMVGKFGDGKGYAETVAAVGDLRRAGRDVGVAMLTGVDPSVDRRWRDQIGTAGLEGHASLLHFRAPWRVAEFHRGCDVMVCLEQDFHVAGHGSSHLEEMLRTGRRLVISRDMRRRLDVPPDACTDALRVVDDPRDVGALAAAIASLLDDPSLADAAREHHPRLARERPVARVDEWIGRLLDDASLAAVARRGDPTARQQRRDRWLDRLFAFVLDAHPLLVDEHDHGPEVSDPMEAADRIARHAAWLEMRANVLLDPEEAERAIGRIRMVGTRVELLHRYSVEDVRSPSDARSGPVSPIASTEGLPTRVCAPRGLRVLDLPVRLLDDERGDPWVVALWPTVLDGRLEVRSVELTRVGRAVVDAAVVDDRTDRIVDTVTAGLGVPTERAERAVRSLLDRGLLHIVDPA